MMIIRGLIGAVTLLDSLAAAAVLIGVLSAAVGFAWMAGLLGASYLAGYLAGTRAQRPQKPAGAAVEGWGDTPPGPPPDRLGEPAGAAEGLRDVDTLAGPAEAQGWLNARQMNLRHYSRALNERFPTNTSPGTRYP